eukprot:g17026.t1
MELPWPSRLLFDRKPEVVQTCEAFQRSLELGCHLHRAVHFPGGLRKRLELDTATAAIRARSKARNGWVSKALLVKTCLFGFVAASLALFSTTASSPLPDVTDGGARRLGAAGLAPLLGDGSAVDWWFAFKLTTSAFPTCSAKPTYGLQYVLSYGSKGKTNAMQLHTDAFSAF